MDMQELYRQVSADFDAWVAANDPYGEMTLLEQVDRYYEDWKKQQSEEKEDELGTRNARSA